MHTSGNKIKVMKGWILILATVSIFSSCFKEDTAVMLPPPGDAQISQIGMGPDYKRQQYFDMGTGDTLGSNYNVWDLCFEAAPSGWHIWINGGNLAMIANMDTQDFDAVTDTFGADWKWDESSWNMDSTAIGDWRNVRMVYVVDLGYEKPAPQRFKKIIFQSLTDDYYEIEFANLDGSDVYVKQVPKNELFSYIYFTFDNGGTTLDIEPDKQRWDMLFTRYRHIFYDEDPPLPYLVTGVLINPGIAVAIDSTLSFGDIDYEKALTFSYSDKRDVIGYDWKYFDFDNAAYVVRSDINYIIRDMEGIYWKLHFIDFYNSIGEKGYPQFEFQRL
ncbi:MAG: HmuY family protein [Chitinophagales bacterium]